MTEKPQVFFFYVFIQLEKDKKCTGKSLYLRYSTLKIYKESITIQ